MLVAAFEHRVLVLADRNLRGKLPTGALAKNPHFWQVNRLTFLSEYLTLPSSLPMVFLSHENFR